MLMFVKVWDLKKPEIGHGSAEQYARARECVYRSGTSDDPRSTGFLVTFSTDEPSTHR